MAYSQHNTTFKCPTLYKKHFNKCLFKLLLPEARRYTITSTQKYTDRESTRVLISH